MPEDGEVGLTFMRATGRARELPIDRCEFFMDNRFSDEERAFFRKLKDERSSGWLTVLLPLLLFFLIAADAYYGNSVPGELLFSPYVIIGIIGLSLLFLASQVITELRFRKQYLSHRSPKSISFMFLRIGLYVTIALAVYWAMRYLLR